jgi:hypothetical protein
MDTLSQFSRFSRAVIILAAIAIVIFFLHAAAAIIAPILLGPEVAEQPEPEEKSGAVG